MDSFLAYTKRAAEKAGMPLTASAPGESRNAAYSRMRECRLQHLPPENAGMPLTASAPENAGMPLTASAPGNL